MFLGTFTKPSTTIDTSRPPDFQLAENSVIPLKFENNMISLHVSVPISCIDFTLSKYVIHSGLTAKEGLLEN